MRALLARLLWRPYEWLREGAEASLVLGFDGTPPQAKPDLISINALHAGDMFEQWKDRWSDVSHT